MKPYRGKKEVSRVEEAGLNNTKVLKLLKELFPPKLTQTSGISDLERKAALR